MALPGLPETIQGITRRARRDAWRFVERETDGRPARAYDERDLPEAARVELARRTAERADRGRALGRKLRLADDVAAHGSRQRVEAGLAEAAELSEAGRARMDARLWALASLNAFAEHAELTGGKAQTTWATLYCEGEMEVPDDVRAELGECVSARSLSRWQRTLEENGPAALAGSYGKRSRRHYERTIDQDPRMQEAVLGLIYEHPRASARQVRRLLVADFGREKVPHVRTIQRYLDDWKSENRQLHAYIENPDAWRSRFGAAAGDASEGITGLNQLWELDSTLTDVLLVQEDGTEKRMALIGLIDVYSRMVRFHLCESSSSRGIAAVLRRGIIELGVPEAVKTDQGADYVSHHVRGVLQSLEIRHLECPPFTPQAKPFIERAFKTLQHDLVEMLDGYVGHDVAERKGIEERKSMADRHAGRRLRVQGMTAERFRDFLDAWRRTIYEREEHGGLGCSPHDRVVEWLQTGIPVRRIGNERALDLLLAPPASGGGVRRVTKKGLSVDAIQYVHPALGAVVGQDVRVLLDETDIGRVVVFDQSGEFLCVAESPEIGGIDRQTVATEMRLAQRRSVRQAEKILKAAATKTRAKDAAQRILDARSGADKVKPLIPAERHMAEGLRAAAEAAEEQARLAEPRTEPAAPSDDELGLLDRLEAQRQAEADAERQAAGRAGSETPAPRPVVVPLHEPRPIYESDAQKYRHLLELRTGGKPLTAEEEDWIRAYENPERRRRRKRL